MNRDKRNKKDIRLLIYAYTPFIPGFAENLVSLSETIVSDASHSTLLFRWASFEIRGKAIGIEIRDPIFKHFD